MRDGRRTLADLGAAVSLSPPAVHRPARAEGVITGYKAHVDHSTLGRPIEAFTGVRFAAGDEVAEIARNPQRSTQSTPSLATPKPLMQWGSVTSPI